MSAVWEDARHRAIRQRLATRARRRAAACIAAHARAEQIRAEILGTRDARKPTRQRALDEPSW